jgi:outer membrane lipoprotein carrier protein
MGKRTLKKLLLLFFCFFLFCGIFQLLAVAPQKTKDILLNLEKLMSQVHSVQCNFVQKKTLPILKNPLVIKGKIYIKDPGFFAWHTSAPIKYTLIIADGVLKQWDKDSGKTVTLNLNDTPGLKVIVGQMKAWFSGRYSDQSGSYNVDVIQEKPLILHFVPKKGSDVCDYVKYLTVEFKNDLMYISKITMKEASGGEINIIFYNVILNKPIPDSAKDLESA